MNPISFACVLFHTKENDSCVAIDAERLFQFFNDDFRLATAAQQQYRTREYKKG